MNKRHWLVLTLLLVVCPLHGQQSSPQRLRKLALLPDWTGLWETELSASLDSGEFARLIGSATEPPGSSPPPSRPGGLPEGTVAPVELEFLRHMKLMGMPPYNPEWQLKYASAVKQLTGASGAPPTPTTAKACSMGFPVVMDSPTPDGMFQALVTPEETLLLFRDGDVRHIYTDGRAHPQPQDLWPTDMGDSIGRWEGNTLVIDTIERKAGPLLPVNVSGVSADLSEQAHFTERLRMLDRNTMQDDLTIDDPLRFSHPWQVSLRYRRVVNVDRMIASNCTENDRNPIVDGKVTIAPPVKEPSP